MTIRVRIERDEKTGRLSAAAVQRYTGGDGRQHEIRGADLLARRVYKDLDKAIQACDAALMREHKLIDPPTIEYIVDGLTGAKQEVA